MPTNNQQNVTDDDIYVNEGDTFQQGIYYPEAPAEQTAEINQKEGIKASSLPILGDIEEWFKAQIVDCDNIHNIQVTRLTINGVQYGRTISVEAQVLAMQILKEKLQEKANEFSGFAEEK